MIRDCERLRRFRKEQIRRERPDYYKNLKIFEALYREAQMLGVFDRCDPLEGIEVRIRMARVLNSV